MCVSHYQWQWPQDEKRKLAFVQKLERSKHINPGSTQHYDPKTTFDGCISVHRLFHRLTCHCATPGQWAERESLIKHLLSKAFPLIKLCVIKITHQRKSSLLLAWMLPCRYYLAEKNLYRKEKEKVLQDKARNLCTLFGPDTIRFGQESLQFGMADFSARNTGVFW